MSRTRLRTPPASTPPTQALHPLVRLGLSVLFVIHLLAVFSAPLTPAIRTAMELNLPPDARPARPPVPWLAELFQPYLDVAYLNHGYNFFAPDPGPSHLVEYVIELEDGSNLTGRFPDLAQQQPRLRYHRHFMLAEQLPGLPPAAAEGFARHLLKHYNARAVALTYIEHRPADVEEVLVHMPLDAAQTYRSRPLVRVTAADAAKPLVVERRPPTPTNNRGTNAPVREVP